MAPPGPATAPVSGTRWRRARTGVALLFLTNGALFADLLPPVPGRQARAGHDATGGEQDHDAVRR